MRVFKVNVTIYAFNSFDDFACFCEYFSKNFNGDCSVFSNKSKLMLYDSVYYLLMYDVCADINLLESFCAGISEFACFVPNSNYFEDKLMEFGEVIIENDAILTVSKFLV